MEISFGFLYLALLFFGVVGIANRRTPKIPWHVALFFFLLVWIFLFESLTLNHVPFPADHLSNLFPWREAGTPSPRSNSELNDLVFQLVPWAHQAREALRAGELPLWNAASGSGYPLLGNGQSAPFSIFRLLALPLSLSSSLGVEAGLKILVALSFTFLFVRRLGSETAALFASISYGFSSFVIVWLNFPHSAVAVFLPAVVFAIDLIVEKLTYRRFLFLVSIFTTLLLNGHPETAAHIILAAGAVLLIRWGELRFRLRNVLPPIVFAGLLAVVIASPVIFPLLESVPRSLRMELIQSRPWTVGRLGLREFLILLQPSFFGRVVDRNVWGPAGAEYITGFSGVLGFVAWMAVMIDSVRRKNFRTTHGLLALLVPVVIALILGVKPISDLFHSIPIFSHAANGRIRFILCFLLSVLAARAIDMALAGEWKPIAAGVLFVALIFATAFWKVDFPSSDARVGSVATSLPALVVLGLAVALPSTRRARPLLLVLSLGAVMFELWWPVHRWNTAVPANQLYPSTPAIEFLIGKQRERELGGIWPFRVAGTTSSFYPNTAAVYGLEDIRVHDPMAYGTYMGMMRALAGYDISTYFPQLRSVASSWLDFLNTRFLLTASVEEIRDERWALIYSGQDARIYENQRVVPRFFIPRVVVNEFDDSRRTRLIRQQNDWAETAFVKRLPSQISPEVRSRVLTPREIARTSSVQVSTYSPDETNLIVNADEWSLVVGSQPQWPGWRVIRNGSERLKIISVNEIFTGFIVPPGESRIRLVYRPMSFYASAIVSIVVCLLLGLWPIIGRKLGHRKRADTDLSTGLT